MYKERLRPILLWSELLSFWDLPSIETKLNLLGTIRVHVLRQHKQISNRGQDHKL